MIKVFVLSLGEVDRPYLQQIKEKWPNANWEFSYYTEKERRQKKYILDNNLKINKEQYTLFKFANEQASDILDRIVYIQNITQYEKIEKNN